MKTPLLRKLAASVLILITGVVAFVGCAAVERAGHDLQFMAGGAAPAATQPSAGQSAVRAAVQVGSAINPAVGEIASLVALLGGVVGGIAGHFNGKRVGAKETKSIVGEIAGDIATFKDPTTPWTEKTRNILLTLGHVDHAFSDSNAPTTPPSEPTA